MKRRNDIFMFLRYFKLVKIIRFAFSVLMFGILIADVSCAIISEIDELVLTNIVCAICCLIFSVSNYLYIGNVKMVIDGKGIIPVALFLLFLVGCIPPVLYVITCGNINGIRGFEFILVYLSSTNIILPITLLAFLCYVYWLEMALIYRNSEQYYKCIKFKEENVV